MPAAVNPTVPEIAVNPDVLKWARTIRGLSPESAADLLDIPLEELLAYEAGTKRPLVGLLRLMSSKYRINFTSLLMPFPLPIPKTPTDHRDRGRQRHLSMDTLVAIEEVTEALDAFGNIASESNLIVPKLRIGSASLSDDPEVLGEKERSRFGVTAEQQHGWRGVGEARREWRKRIEARGVFTYMIPMPLDELSGFSMFRDGLAAICVNDREFTEGAKTFTLFHEYCHLLLRKAGISDENNRNKVERFCNRFAASFLMPRDELLRALSGFSLPYEFTDSDIKHLSAHFRVSNSAVALRLQETGAAPKGFYARRTGTWDKPKEGKPTEREGTPSYTVLRIKRLGRLHTSVVLRAAKYNLINSFDASDLTGLSPKTIAKLQAAVG